MYPTNPHSSLSKEHKLYVQEAGEQQRRVDKFIEDKAEEWDIKNGASLLACNTQYLGNNHLIQRKMVEESLKMIANAETLLSKAVGDLNEVVVSIFDILIIATCPNATLFKRYTRARNLNWKGMKR